MKEIIELNKRIQTEAADVVPKEFGCFFVDREHYGRDELAVLPTSIREDLDTLCARLDEVIPSDFNYTMLLGDDQPSLQVSYNDGPLATAGCPLDFDKKRSIIDQLRSVDWEAERQGLLTMCQTFEHLKEFAEHRPIDLPSTEELQTTFRKEMVEFLAKKQKDDGKLHLLMYREDNGLNPDFGIQEESRYPLSQIVGALMDVMTCHFWVISIVVNGKPLSVTEIESQKNKALHELREHMPISYAKATGRL